MIDFILSNFQAVAGLILAIILVGYAIFTRQWNLVQLAAYKFMLSAERLMATEQGKVKMKFVFNAMWEQLPRWLKTFVTEETLKDKLQEWYELAKDYMADGTINKSTPITK